MRIILFIESLLALVFVYAMCRAGKEADEKYEELFQKKFAPDGGEFRGN